MTDAVRHALVREAAQAAVDFLGQTSWEDGADEAKAWAVLDRLRAALVPIGDSDAKASATPDPDTATPVGGTR